MENIINQIVDIDMQAQKRLNEAKKLREDYRRSLEEKIEKANKELSEKEKASIDRALKVETEAATAERSATEIQNKEILSHLHEIYQKNHEQLEEEIFNNVVKDFMS